MSRSLNDYISQLQPIIRDRTDGTVTTDDVKESLNRGIRYLMNRHGVHATKNRSVIKIFPDVCEYPLPSDFHDLITVSRRGEPVKFTMQTPVEFWLRLNQSSNTLGIDTILGDRYLLCNYPSAGSSTLIHDCDSVTSNGTWSVGDDAENLTADSVNKQAGSASLSFDIDVSDSGNDYASIVNSTLNSVDLSAHTDKGTLFMWVYLPTITNLVSVTTRWGNDASNYYSVTETDQFNGQALRVGWNRLGFAWSGATETGAVTDTAIDYFYTRFTYSASFTDSTGFKVDDIKMESPEDMELFYYSNSFVETSGGVAQQVFENNDDVTLLADEDDDILLWWALSEASWIKEKFNERAEAKKEFEDLLSRFKARYPSERKRATARYY